MKKPHAMRMDELVSLPVFTTSAILNRVETFGGCFRDPKGVLWGTCLLEKGWVRFPAVRLAERTGLSEATLDRPSTLRGYIDHCDNVRVDGWAQDEADPGARIYLDVSIHGRLVARTCANLPRHDLVSAGIGDGKHGFGLEWPKPLARGTAHLVVVQRSDDGVLLDVALVAADAAAP